MAAGKGIRPIVPPLGDLLRSHLEGRNVVGLVVRDLALLNVKSQFTNYARHVWMNLTAAAVALEDMTRKGEVDDELDEALKGTFPGSDPVSLESPFVPGSPRRKSK